jgi:hypothetical protein
LVTCQAVSRQITKTFWIRQILYEPKLLNIVYPGCSSEHNRGTGENNQFTAVIVIDCPQNDNIEVAAAGFFLLDANHPGLAGNYIAGTNQGVILVLFATVQQAKHIAAHSLNMRRTAALAPHLEYRGKCGWSDNTRQAGCPGCSIVKKNGTFIA